MRGYQMQHWWADTALAQVDLYEGAGRAAFNRVRRAWRPAQRALVFGMELVAFDARHLRVRAALAAAAEGKGSEREEALRSAAKDIRALRGPPYGGPWQDLFTAAIANLRGERGQAAAHLRRAIAGFAAWPVPIWSAAAKLRLGEIEDSEEAERLAREGASFFKAQGVVDVLSMARVFAPGFDGRRSPRLERALSGRGG